MNVQEMVNSAEDLDCVLALLSESVIVLSQENESLREEVQKLKQEVQALKE